MNTADRLVGASLASSSVLSRSNATSKLDIYRSTISDRKKRERASVHRRRDCINPLLQHKTMSIKRKRRSFHDLLSVLVRDGQE